LEILFEKRHIANARGSKEKRQNCCPLYSFEERSKFFNLTTLEMGKIKGDLIEAIKNLNGI
jgi:hypothetical protein